MRNSACKKLLNVELFHLLFPLAFSLYQTLEQELEIKILKLEGNSHEL